MMKMQECSFTINNYDFPAEDSGFLATHLDSLSGDKKVASLVELTRNHAKDCFSDTASITYSVDFHHGVLKEYYLIGPSRDWHKTGDFYPYMAVVTFCPPWPGGESGHVNLTPAEAATEWVQECQAHPSVVADVAGANNYTYLINQAKQFIMAAGSDAAITVAYDSSSDRVCATITPHVCESKLCIRLYLG